MRRLAPIALALVAAAVAVAALDRGVALLGLDHEAPRGRPNQDRRLERPEFAVRVVTNALGFRERRLPSPKPPGTVRVVAVGDSFTQGFGVEAVDAFPSRLEGLLDARDPGRRHEVVNLGVPGTSPRDYLAYLRDPGLAYAPDVVLVAVMANDVQDVRVQREQGVAFGGDVLVAAQREVADGRSAWQRLPERLLPALYPLVWTRLHAAVGGAGAATASAGPAPAVATAGPAPAGAPPGAAAAAPAGRVPPDRWQDVLVALARRYGRESETRQRLSALPPDEVRGLVPVLTGAVRLDDEGAVDAYQRVMALVDPRVQADAVLLPAAYDDAWAATASAIGSIVRTARGAGARPMIVFVPAVHQVTEAARPPLEAAGFTWDARTLTDRTLADRLVALGRSLDVPVVDLLPVLRARAAEPLYYPRDGHWTALGHAVAAAAIAPAVPLP